MNGPRISRLRITVLMEHRSDRKDMAKEHGLSLWIEANEHRILFDTGQSAAFADNAQRLGIDLSQADVLFLSHGHYDHTGGLAVALGAASKAKLYFHPEVGIPRYSQHPDQPRRAIGMPPSSWEALAPRWPEAYLTTGPTRIFDGIWATGPIPRRFEPEHPQRGFSRDAEGLVPDRFTDDQALVFETVEGLMIVTGCCHAGVRNTLVAAQQIVPDDRIFALVGGLHLMRSDASRIAQVLEALRAAKVKSVLSGHCTGDEAEACLGSQATVLKAGMSCELFPCGFTPSPESGS